MTLSGNKVIKHILLLKARILFLFCVLYCSFYLQATTIPNATLKTTYKDGVYTTSCYVIAEAQKSIVDVVVDDLILEFQGDPERLFDWALKGVGQQKDGSEKDAVILVFNSTAYNPSTGISCLNVDAVVPGFTAFRDINIESKVTDEQLTDGRRRVLVDIFYAKLFLKMANGEFYIKPISEHKTQIAIRINIEFGWFFNLFVSQKRYKSLAEFRIEKFMDNMHAESERREQSTMKN